MELMVYNYYHRIQTTAFQKAIRLLSGAGGRGADATDTAATLLEDRDAQLDRILDDLHTDLTIIDQHQVDLAQIVPALSSGLTGFASIGYAGLDQTDNPSWGNVFAANLGIVGVAPITECDGILDRLFTELIGPDPRCPENENPGNIVDLNLVTEIVESILEQGLPGLPGLPGLDGIGGTGVGGASVDAPVVAPEPVTSFSRFLVVPGVAR